MKTVKKMAIISGYFEGDSCGLLGPQMAATIIQENTSFECIVLALGKNEEQEQVKTALAEYFGRQRPVVGFANLHGRPDLFALAKELTQEGAMTILAGPQALADYWGEFESDQYPERFSGLTEHFVCALHGPAEQAIFLLNSLETDQWIHTPGLQYRSEQGHILSNPVQSWDERFLSHVNWESLYQIEETSLKPLTVKEAQVVHQIGCPYAATKKMVAIDYPVSLHHLGVKLIELPLRGCSFCDVAQDKGFYGSLDLKTVISQIRCLPELPDGRKIPFELINENPLPSLETLLKEVNKSGLSLSQINLTMRADWFARGHGLMRQALETAQEYKIKILLASVGFETFDDQLLQNLNKGIDVGTNLKAVQLMRTLKLEFPETWKYARTEGGLHGFIHPTPWDTPEIEDRMQGIIYPYALFQDILPERSIPLIIHHASGLGQWIREIELAELIAFPRIGSIIAWWGDIRQIKRGS
jgi:hypothetical protein